MDRLSSLLGSNVLLPLTNWWKRSELALMSSSNVPFGRVRPEKLSLSVRTYPSLGGSTISANLPYVFLVSCRVSSGRPPLDDDEGAAASWESDGVDIDRNTFSGSDTEACNMHGLRADVYA